MRRGVRGRRSSSGGFTLVELTMAMGVFSIVIGFTAQVLVSYFGTLDLTHQRTEAMQNAVGVLNTLRALRDEHPDDFAAAMLAKYPQGAVIKDDAATAPDARLTSLLEEELAIAYVDESGRDLSDDEIASAPAVRVRVTSRWRSPQGGRWANAMVETVLSKY